MRVHIYRTAMIGGGLAYDVQVPESDVPEYTKAASLRIIRQGMTYLTFVDATLPEGHHDLDKGWDRYQAYLSHEESARARMLALAQSVYPELAGVNTWPIMWLSGLPVDRETHDMRVVDV